MVAEAKFDLAPKPSLDEQLERTAEEPLNEQIETPVIFEPNAETAPLVEVLDTELLEINLELIDSDSDSDSEEELITEIMPEEAVDEGLLAIQQEPETLHQIEENEEDIETNEIILPSQELADEFQQAAILSLGEVGSEVEINSEEVETIIQYQDGLEALQKDPVTIIELLPIEPEELVEKLETIPEVRLQEAAAILKVVLQAVQRADNNRHAGETDIESVDETGLEQMVERLLVCLEIEHDEKQMSVIIKKLLSGDLELDFEELLSRQEEGTHECKYVRAWIISVLNRQLIPKPSAHTYLGRYTLRLSILTNSQSLATPA